jgi:hypothetical protein
MRGTPALSIAKFSKGILTMSEHQSIANNPEALAEALGANQSIYVGSLDILASITGAGLARIRAAQLAREVATAEPDHAIPAAIGRLASLVDAGAERDRNLSKRQSDTIAGSIRNLLNIHTGSAERPPAATIRALYGLYFKQQEELTDTGASSVLRLVADDFALQVDYDLDLTWEIYQEVNQKHQTA